MLWCRRCIQSRLALISLTSRLITARTSASMKSSRHRLRTTRLCRSSELRRAALSTRADRLSTRRRNSAACKYIVITVRGTATTASVSLSFWFLWQPTAITGVSLRWLDRPTILHEHVSRQPLEPSWISRSRSLRSMRKVGLLSKYKDSNFRHMLTLYKLDNIANVPGILHFTTVVGVSWRI